MLCKLNRTNFCTPTPKVTQNLSMKVRTFLFKSRRRVILKARRSFVVMMIVDFIHSSLSLSRRSICGPQVTTVHHPVTNILSTSGSSIEIIFPGLMCMDAVTNLLCRTVHGSAIVPAIGFQDSHDQEVNISQGRF